jgi:hypothetical protein
MDTPPVELYAPLLLFLSVIGITFVCCRTKNGPLLPRYRTPGRETDLPTKGAPPLLEPRSRILLGGFERGV